MKNLILLVLLTLSTIGLSQKSETVVTQSFKKSQLSEFKLITDIIPEIPKGSKIIAFDIVTKSDGKMVTAHGNSDELPKKPLVKSTQARNFIST